ncbi:endoribonuclease L-PSP family protein [Burkholderia cenocepacia]|uniref:Endoribonuclease L-PSP family protein n=1 Tax=Burkholderia cenocepacia TaxID=95486 RepID=A0AAN0VMQ4_9BURK|nr:endoribonuclease L-PSP family protein [Burkholderia cenocepacia]
MAETIPVDLPPLAQPFSWATRAAGLMFTGHGPVDAAGAIVGDTMAEQARVTLGNLAKAVAAAGATMDDVAQVLVYLSDVQAMPEFDAEYRRHFRAPYPNRTCVGVQGFAHPEMRVELVAYVALPTVRT